jgi:hypothetical protein
MKNEVIIYLTYLTLAVSRLSEANLYTDDLQRVCVLTLIFFLRLIRYIRDIKK